MSRRLTLSVLTLLFEVLRRRGTPALRPKPLPPTKLGAKKCEGGLGVILEKLDDLHRLEKDQAEAIKKKALVTFVKLSTLKAASSDSAVSPSLPIFNRLTDLPIMPKFIISRVTTKVCHRAFIRGESARATLKSAVPILTYLQDHCLSCSPHWIQIELRRVAKAKASAAGQQEANRVPPTFRFVKLQDGQEIDDHAQDVERFVDNDLIGAGQKGFGEDFGLIPCPDDLDDPATEISRFLKRRIIRKICTEVGNGATIAEQQEPGTGEPRETGLGVSKTWMLVLRVVSPSNPDLDLIDVPGVMMRAPEGEEATNAARNSNDLVDLFLHRYRERGFFILDVAGDRPASDSIVGRIKELQLEQRSIGVFSVSTDADDAGLQEFERMQILPHLASSNYEHENVVGAQTKWLPLIAPERNPLPDRNPEMRRIEILRTLNLEDAGSDQIERYSVGTGNEFFSARMMGAQRKHPWGVIVEEKLEDRSQRKLRTANLREHVHRRTDELVVRLPYYGWTATGREAGEKAMTATGREAGEKAIMKCALKALRVNLHCR